MTSLEQRQLQCFSAQFKVLFWAVNLIWVGSGISEGPSSLLWSCQSTQSFTGRSSPRVPAMWSCVTTRERASPMLLPHGDLTCSISWNLLQTCKTFYFSTAFRQPGWCSSWPWDDQAKGHLGPVAISQHNRPHWVVEWVQEDGRPMPTVFYLFIHLIYSIYILPFVTRRRSQGCSQSYKMY